MDSTSVCTRSFVDKEGSVSALMSQASIYTESLAHLYMHTHRYTHICTYKHARTCTRTRAHVQIYTLVNNLIIINVTHISMFRNSSFNFGRNVAKRGRNMERCRERNIAEPKFELWSFRPSSCVFYVRGHI